MGKRAQAIIEMFELSELHRALGYDTIEECLDNESVDFMESVLREQSWEFELELAEFLDN